MVIWREFSEVRIEIENLSCESAWFRTLLFIYPNIYLLKCSQLNLSLELDSRSQTMN